MSEIKRIWCISDLHFGVHSNNVEWLEIMEDYYNNFFIPLLKRDYQDGDVLFILGDVMDNRQNMNVVVFNKVLEIFENLAEVLPIHIIVGNHDIAKKSDNDVNSLKFLKYIENITVYENPTVLQLSNNKKCLMLPWCATDDIANNHIKSNRANYLFAHMAINSFYYNRKVMIDYGVEYDDIKQYDRVFTGHIHYTQNKYNIYMVGSPYELTRNDVNNQKNVYLLDVATNKVAEIPNTYSPRFIKLRLSNILEMDVEKFSEIVNNNFVDIVNDLDIVATIQFDKLVEMMKGARKLNLFIGNKVEDDVDVGFDDNTDFDITNLDLLTIAKNHIDTINYDAEIKTQVYLKVVDLYNQIKNREIHLFETVKEQI